jgi:hypothetical protein
MSQLSRLSTLAAAFPFINGTWLFLIGSIFFGLKPTIRLIHEWRLLK